MLLGDRISEKKKQLGNKFLSGCLSLGLTQEDVENAEQGRIVKNTAALAKLLGIPLEDVIRMSIEDQSTTS